MLSVHFVKFDWPFLSIGVESNTPDIAEKSNQDLKMFIQKLDVTQQSQ